MKINYKNMIDKVQIILFVLFVLLWFISSEVYFLRIISIVIFALFSFIQLLKIWKKRNLSISKSVLYYLFFSIWCFLSVFWAMNKTYVMDKSFDLLCNTIFLCLSYDFFKNINISKKNLFTIFISIGLLFSIYVLYYYGIEEYFTLLLSGNRVGGDIINVNFIGLIGSITFLIIIYSVHENIYKNKLILLISLLPLIVSLGTGSKKVLLILAIGIGLLFIMINKEKLTMKRVINTTTSIVLIIFLFFAIKQSPYFSTVFNRFDDMISTLNNSAEIDGSTLLRRMYIEKGLEYFFKKPIGGIGINNSKIITSQVDGSETYLHCNYVELLSCVGIIGFILYYLIYIHYLIKYFKVGTKDKTKELSLVLIVITLATEIGCVTYYEIKTSMYILLISILLDKNNWQGDGLDGKKKEIT